MTPPTQTADERAALAAIPVTKAVLAVLAKGGDNLAIHEAIVAALRTPDTGAGDGEVGELIARLRERALTSREIGYVKDARLDEDAADALARLSHTGSAVTEAAKPFASGGQWGTWLAWLVAGAPDNEKGRAAAKGIVRARAALEAALGSGAAGTAAAGWRPIQTAPKDGTPILLASSFRVGEASWGECRRQAVDGYRANAGEPCWRTGDNDRVFPPGPNGYLGWQPLPAAPVPPALDHGGRADG